jgi:SAM-dependent methyltransferase
LKIPRLNAAWRRWRALRGNQIGNYHDLPAYIRQHVSGRSFADIGCMWGVNGEYSFIAEDAGATSVKAVDVFGPTPEFEVRHRERGSAVDFILGDVTNPATLDRIGQVDVVFCAGVLYHHPSPFDLLVALRRICRQVLILRTSTIPEIRGLPNAAVYFPMLRPHDRTLWNLRRLGVTWQTGITDHFDPSAGYGNWFWGLTPSCLISLVRTAGFKVVSQATEPFAQTLVCSPVEAPFEHRLPDARESRELGAAISSSGLAKPA